MGKAGLSDVGPGADSSESVDQNPQHSSASQSGAYHDGNETGLATDSDTELAAKASPGSAFCVGSACGNNMHAQPAASMTTVTSTA